MQTFDFNFVPYPLLRGPIAQTVVGSRATGYEGQASRILHKVHLDPRNTLVLWEHPSKSSLTPLVIMAHGMGGCSESDYMRRIGGRLRERGYGVFLMNHRGSGPGMGLCDRLWNGGSSDDLARVVEYVVQRYPNRPVLLVGFSLSGNILLKYLGEGRKIHRNVYAALAVNPPIDLEIASRKISEGPWAGTFNRYYLKLMTRQIRAMQECFPETFAPTQKYKTIYEFDVAYTAPVGGYQDVQEYYRQCSSKQFLDSIRVPTTILCSRDDPFIPGKVFDDAHFSLCVDYVGPERGGHMGYISKSKTPLGDRRWLDYFCLEWARRNFPELSEPGSTETNEKAALLTH